MAGALRVTAEEPPPGQLHTPKYGFDFRRMSMCRKIPAIQFAIVVTRYFSEPFRMVTLVS